MTVTSFAVTLYGHSVLPTPCCRSTDRKRHISVVRSCLSICSLCSESNRLLRLLIAVLETSIFLHVTNLA